MTSNAEKLCPDVLNLLRARTRDVHQRLHVHPVMRHLVRRSLTLDQYVFALQALDRFHESVEAELLCLPGGSNDRQASALLKQDYLKLTNARVNPLTPCPALSLSRSPDSRLGVLYVLEGSRQGGSIMARNIKKTLNLDRNNGAAYFSNENNASSQDWRVFSKSLQERCSDAAVCAEAAERTFNRLESYLWMINRERCNWQAMHAPAQSQSLVSS